MRLLSMSSIAMFKILTYLMYLVGLALTEDELITKLIDEHGANRVTVCKENGTECEGVLWKAQWVITRASCLTNKPFYQLGAIKSKERTDCTEYNTELVKNSARVRKVQVVFKHPSYEESPRQRPEHDLALLRLEFSYSEAERLFDTRVPEALLEQFEPWLENTIRSNQPDKPYVRRYPRRFGVGMFESPMKTFISMVVVPSILFIAFFFFITCFTKPKTRPVLRQVEKI